MKSIAAIRDAAPERGDFAPIDLAQLIETITDELQAAFRTGGGKDLVDLGARTRIANAMQ